MKYFVTVVLLRLLFLRLLVVYCNNDDVDDSLADTPSLTHFGQLTHFRPRRNYLTHFPRSYA